VGEISLTYSRFSSETDAPLPVSPFRFPWAVNRFLFIATIRLALSGITSV